MSVCEHSNTLPEQVPAGTVVYKDDCMYSFDTPENNVLGLDVCLICFKGYSRGDINYTAKHTEDSQHSLFLNIIKKLKPQAERDQLKSAGGDGEERHQKIAKLEIKEYKEEEMYDILYLVYCSTDDKSFPLDTIPETVQKLCQSVINASSSSRQEEIKAWEQEILPCEHSIEPQQVDIGEVDLTKCLQCDLKENLWICIHCGALGCGRQQFGSTIPGNSHALSHYDIAGHPVAVKLGSLSADDLENYDAYCYKCNDEIKIPNLVECLQKYGIDLSKVTKTEKNLTELNLDQNMNWEFQLDGKNGEKLAPIFGKNFTGLTNLGNSCYLNSVVQALFHLKPYLEFFKDQKFPNYEEVPDPSKDLLSQLIKVYDGLISGRYSKSSPLKGDDYQLGIKPTMFKSLVGEDHVEFKTNKQQDAFEFLLYLLDLIDKRFGFEINEPLKFLMTNKVVCSGCLKGKASDELIDNLSLNIEDEVLSVDEEGKKQYKKVDLIDSFQQYCEDEVIEGYKCGKCNQTTEAIKSCGFKSYPEVLIVNVKRIKLENWVPVKVDVPIKVPEEINLSHFKAEVNEELEVEQPAGAGGNKFEPNPDILNNLIQMGFPEPRCIKALYTTGNSSLDEAMNWIFAHMEDPDIDEPLKESETSAAPPGEDVSEEMIANLMAMGFSHQLSKKALVLNNNDPNVAVEWLFNNPDDDGVIPTLPTPINMEAEKSKLTEKLNNSNTDNSQYTLKSVICHKGTSPHTGHYVVFIKTIVDGKAQWVLYNDEKVVECDDSSIKDMETNGYIYIFEKLS